MRCRRARSGAAKDSRACDGASRSQPAGSVDVGRASSGARGSVEECVDELPCGSSRRNRASAAALRGRRPRSRCVRGAGGGRPARAGEAHARSPGRRSADARPRSIAMAAKHRQRATRSPPPRWRCRTAPSTLGAEELRHALDERRRRRSSRTLNDYTATVIGMIRDDVPFDRGAHRGPRLRRRAPASSAPATRRRNNDHYRALEDSERRPRQSRASSCRCCSRRCPARMLAASDTAGVITTRAAGEAFFSARHQPPHVALHRDELPVPRHGAAQGRDRARRTASART